MFKIRLSDVFLALKFVILLILEIDANLREGLSKQYI